MAVPNKHDAYAVGVFTLEEKRIRHEATLSFMDQDACFMDKVKPSKMDEGFFRECRQVVLALTTEQGNAALPKLNI